MKKYYYLVVATELACVQLPRPSIWTEHRVIGQYLLLLFAWFQCSPIRETQRYFLSISKEKKSLGYFKHAFVLSPPSKIKHGPQIFEQDDKGDDSLSSAINSSPQRHLHLLAWEDCVYISAKVKFGPCFIHLCI